MSEQFNAQAALEKLFFEIPSIDPLRKFRVKAWEHFLELGLPTPKNECYKSVNLKHLLSQEFSTEEEEADAAIPSPCHENSLLFINGKYRSDLSKYEKEITALPLSESLSQFGSILNHYWNKSIKAENDPFAALNSALHPEGLFLYIPPNTVVEKPIHLFSISNGKVVQPRIYVFMGRNSCLTIASKTLSSDQTLFLNSQIELILDDGAQLSFIQDSTDTSQNTTHFEFARGSLKRDSVLNMIAVTNGSRLLKNDYKMSLLEENSCANLNGLWNLKGKDEAHMRVLMEHCAPNCRSQQLFKGVLNDLSRSSFAGKIYVHKEAQKTDAYQMNRNLLIGDRVYAESRPNLEIFADDVKASHGSTIGSIDAEQLFYLQTRGFSKAEANRILISGFCQEILDMLPLELQSKISQNFYENGRG